MDKKVPLQMNIEYIRQDNLSRLRSTEHHLFVRSKGDLCVIQKFVWPYSNHNSTFSAVWSREFTIFSTVSNIHLLSDTKLSLEERLPTYEGDHRSTVQKPVKGDLTKKEVDRICKSVIAHLNSMSKNQFGVNHLDLYFKLDRSNVLWIVFCNSIRLIDYKASLKDSKGADSHALGAPFQAAQKRSDLEPPHKLRLTYGIVHPDLKIEVGDFLTHMLMNDGDNILRHKPEQIHCSLCLETADRLFNRLPLHLLLRHLRHRAEDESLRLCNTEQKVERFLSSLANGDELIERHRMILANKSTLKGQAEEQDLRKNHIPTVLQWSLGHLSTQELLARFKNASFLNADLKVCDSCYLKYTAQ